MEAISAQTLEYHYIHALPVIAQTRWDDIVLQEVSGGPLPEARGGKPMRFYSGANMLEQAIHAVNPRAKLYLYETWARPDMTYSEKAPYAGETLEAMTRDLHDGYYREFTQNGHFAAVAPVGDAFMRAVRSGLAIHHPDRPPAPGLADLWYNDSYHPSVHGAYLAALVFFQQITGTDARTLGPAEQAAVDLGITSDVAVKLQQTAFEQVSAEPGIAPPETTPPGTPLANPPAG